MGYLHIENAYKYPAFFRCYALEKVHGTSAHVAWRDGRLRFFSGGEPHERFAGLFDAADLATRFASAFAADKEVIVYGEAYGGKQQGMGRVYGTELRFVAFDVFISEEGGDGGDGTWADVPMAAAIVESLGLRFVPYEEGPIDQEWLDSQRDRDSLVAIGPGMPREGIVIRPIREAGFNNGCRMICKHKRPEFRETKTYTEISADKLAILSDAAAVAAEWVTEMRLEHVLQRDPFQAMSAIRKVIDEMIEDVRRESEWEVEWSSDVSKAVSRATSKMLLAKVSELPGAKV